MKGKISIGKYMNSDLKEPVYIELEDTLSRIRIFEIHLNLENFADILTGRHAVECEYEAYGLDKIGMVREHKTEIIPLSKYPSEFTDEQLQAILDPFEVHGWIGRWEDFKNYHNWNSREKTCRVSFVRWVKTSENKEE